MASEAQRQLFSDIRAADWERNQAKDEVKAKKEERLIKTHLDDDRLFEEQRQGQPTYMCSSGDRPSVVLACMNFRPKTLK